MTVSPFHFKLKKVSGQEERLLSAIYSYLPATGLEDKFAGAVTGAISRHLGCEFSVELQSLHYTPAQEFLAKLPKSPVLAVFGMTPLNTKAIVEIDEMLAMMIVEKILGGSVENVSGLRPLSDTEQGVLQYLILQVLSEIHRACGMEERVHFRFDKFAFSSPDIRDVLGGEPVAACVFKATIGRRAGFLRLVLPEPFAAEAVLGAKGKNEKRAGENAWFMKQIGRFGYVRFPLIAEAGRLSVTREDLSGLEEGDVVIFDHSDVSMAGKVPRGNVLLRFGEGADAGIEAEITSDRKRLSVKVIGVHKGE